MNSDKQTRARALELLRANFEREQQAAWSMTETMFNFWVAKCESPIEELMLGALAFALHGELGASHTVPCFTETSHSSLMLEPQKKIGSYRVDFAIHSVNGAAGDARTEAKIVVECDGHDFHERTKEQAARDKARDRFLSSEGWIVLRFTGREIVRDPAGCADVVAEQLEAEFRRQLGLLQRAMLGGVAA